MAISSGFYQGIVSMLFTGSAFGLTMYFYENSKTVKNQTKLDSGYLLPGEHIVFSKAGGLVFKPKDYGLKNFAFDDLMWTTGMKDKESIAGELYLTNYRLIHKSTKLNRLRGVFSIFLPTIKQVSNSSFFIAKKITVETYSSRVVFTMYDEKEMFEKISA